MIDIHLHLDGSLSQEDFKYLSKTQGIPLPSEFPNNIYVNKDCKSLEEYLERFDLPLLFMQTAPALEYCTYSLVKRLAKLGYIYAEIRYAPLLHLNKGLKMSEVVEATIRGLKKGLAECKGFDANLILCCMRHADESLNMETAELVHKYRDDKVCGIDIAGAESIHPSPYFKKVFDLAKSYGENITIHAGESTGNQEVMDAIDNGAMRIGHGVHLEFDEASVRKVKDHNVCFEFCPTSNLQTKSLKTYNDVPVKNFSLAGIPFTINSDNMTVSNVNAIEEMKEMIKTFSFTKNDVKKLIENSINHSFAKPEDKIKIKENFEQNFEVFYLNNYLN